MLPLDSPRWNSAELGHGTIPDLIAEIAVETTPNYGDGGAWHAVYSGLYHQHSTYARTYAAFPHIVRVAGSGTPGQRLAVLCLAGNLCVHAQPDEPIPEEFMPAYEAALASVRATSLATVRAASRPADIDENTTLADVLEAFGGLRQPRSGYVTQLAHLEREGWQVEPVCPACQQVMVAELRDTGATTLQVDGRGNTLPATARRTPIDRAGYPAVLAQGQAILARGAADWTLAEMPAVLAALADECGDALLATRVLDLGANVLCAHCGKPFALRQGLEVA